MTSHNKQTVSVIVPANPFIRKGRTEVSHCLAALDVNQLMEWWPGTPHAPHRNSEKVRAIQRSLDWKRVAQIAAYLLQEEIVDAPEKIIAYFDRFYGANAGEPGREWPPRVPNVAKYQRSEYPTFSNVLLHVNGASIKPLPVAERDGSDHGGKTANLVFDELDTRLNFSVIDGQHRINGAYLAVSILREKERDVKWDIPSEIFLDLDASGSPPRRQAQIFIDVNFYQKKVDRSLVADLFPTARGSRDALDHMERAQDLGRRLMLETGPLVGMVQIPGIKFGVKDVVTLSTLNSALEGIIGDLFDVGIQTLSAQAEFLAQCLQAWLEATGRKEEVAESESLDPENVAYQGRTIVTFLTLVPACIWELTKSKHKIALISDAAVVKLTVFLRATMRRAGLMRHDKFLSKTDFKNKGFLGSGGLARFRDALWAASVGKTTVARLRPERLAQLAEFNRAKVRKELLKRAH